MISSGLASIDSICYLLSKCNILQYLLKVSVICQCYECSGGYENRTLSGLSVLYHSKHRDGDQSKYF